MKQQNRVLLGTIIVLVLSGLVYVQAGQESPVTLERQRVTRLDNTAAEITVPSIAELQAQIKPTGSSTSQSVPIMESDGTDIKNPFPRGRWWDE